MEALTINTAFRHRKENNIYDHKFTVEDTRLSFYFILFLF